MNVHDSIEVCKICKNRKFSSAEGIVCGLTSAKPTFSENCPDYLVDEDQKKRESRFQKSHSSKEINKETAVKILSGGLPLVAIGLFLTIFPMPYVVAIIGVLCLIVGLVFTAYGFARFLIQDTGGTKKHTKDTQDKNDLEVF